jgi:D-alanine transaminase
LILELAAADHIPCKVGPVPEAAVRGADEIWLTSSTREVLPITVLDGKPVGRGQPGPLFKRMDALYQNYKATVMRQAV